MLLSIWNTVKLGTLVLSTAAVAASGIAVANAGRNPAQSAELAAPVIQLAASDRTSDRIDIGRRRTWLFKTSADILGLGSGELRDQLIDNGSLAAVAEDVGLGADVLTAELVDRALARIGDRSTDRIVDVEQVTERIEAAIDVDLGARALLHRQRAERRSSRVERTPGTLSVSAGEPPKAQ